MPSTHFKSFKLPIIFLAGSTFFATINSEAHPPHVSEIAAVIQTINPDKKMLTLNYPQGQGPENIVWNSNTVFLCNGKSAMATELKAGTATTIFYHAPFFGKPFATKITWATAVEQHK